MTCFLTADDRDEDCPSRLCHLMKRCLREDGDEPIQTSHIYPPIPLRQFDWCAYRDPERGPVGYGCTEEEAVRDLLLEEGAEDAP